MTEVGKTDIFVENMMKIIYSLSFYAPIIVCISIIVFSIFNKTMEKAFVFFMWIFFITSIRIGVLTFFPYDTKITRTGSEGKDIVMDIPDTCLTGLTEIFIPKDVTYSTYILTFTATYLIGPMLMISSQKKVNMMNYGVLAFFIIYIIIDIAIKTNLSCVQGFLSRIVLGEILSGIFLGGVVSCLAMYGTPLKSYLYINEINTNKEVCSMPSKQQFKCRVFKDGTLISES
jgi:hypothetical protein